MTAEVRVGGQAATYTATWTINVTRGDFIDATCFGDTNRTYLVPAPQITIEGATEQGEDVRLTLGRFRRRPETTMQPPTAEAEATGTVGVNAALGNVYFNHLAVGTTTNIRFDGNINGTAADIQFEPGLTPEVTETLNRLMYYTTNEIRFTTRTPRENEALRKQRAKAEAGRAKAHDRAMQLLLSHLDETQRKMVEKYHTFYVKGQSLTYKIQFEQDRGASVSTMKPRGSFCINPRPALRDGVIPAPDQALALKMLIEADEAEFLLTGNWTGKQGDRTYSLVRMGIDGAPSKQGYTSRFYGQPNQPEDVRQEGFLAAYNWTFNYEEVP